MRRHHLLKISKKLRKNDAHILRFSVCIRRHNVKMTDESIAVSFYGAHMPLAGSKMNM